MGASGVAAFGSRSRFNSCGARPSCSAAREPSWIGSYLLSLISDLVSPALAGTCCCLATRSPSSFLFFFFFFSSFLLALNNIPLSGWYYIHFHMRKTAPIPKSQWAEGQTGHSDLMPLLECSVYKFIVASDKNAETLSRYARIQKESG